MRGFHFSAINRICEAAVSVIKYGNGTVFIIMFHVSFKSVYRDKNLAWSAQYTTENNFKQETQIRLYMFYRF